MRHGPSTTWRKNFLRRGSQSLWRASSTATKKTPDNAIHRKRVLGVIAHINSGKTTTTEAMLYRSGTLSRMGNVDVGDTATDHLPAERERGITVSSAAAHLHWRGHDIFLVDSPGHLDFTFEVERALRAMDSAVVILDAVAGIQPQTEVVWKQADNNNLPRLLFVNKLDRDGADFSNVVKSVHDRFGTVPIVTHVPLQKTDGTLSGVFNLMSLFPTEETGSTNAPDNHLNETDREMVHNAKDQLVETCAELDDSVMETWVNGDIPTKSAIANTIRNACVSSSAVPVLCGSSLREVGVEQLLNSIVAFLPSPVQRKWRGVDISQNDHFVAYAFKVIHDRHRGRLVFFRVITGSLPRKMMMLNTTTGQKEMPTRLLRVFADKYVDIESVAVGDLFAAVGLKNTSTGDTLMMHGIPKDSHVILPGVPSPPAVFAVAVEPESTSHEPELEKALAVLVDEDSSLELRRDDDTGETLVAGMGELHLDVALDHMRRKLSFDIIVSAPRVAYRECVTSSTRVSDFCLDSVIGSSRLYAQMDVSLAPHGKPDQTNDENIHSSNSNTIDVDFAHSLSQDECRPEIEDAVRQGIAAALGRGPLIGAPVRKAHVFVSVIQAADIASARAGAARAVKAALVEATPALLEPVMLVRAVVPHDRVGDIVAEMTHPTRRRGVMTDIGMSQEPESSAGVDVSSLSAIIPVEGLIGFSTKFRSLTKGRGELQMTFAEYQIVDRTTQQRIVEHQQG